jgi:hypothetical protein
MFHHAMASLLKMLLAIALLLVAYLALNGCQSHRADGLPSTLREYVEQRSLEEQPAQRRGIVVRHIFGSRKDSFIPRPTETPVFIGFPSRSTGNEAACYGAIPVAGTSCLSSCMRFAEW